MIVNTLFFCEIPVKYIASSPPQEFPLPERLEDRSHSAVDMEDQKDKRKGDTNQQHGALNKVRPEYGFQASRVGVNDRDHSHHNDQDIDVDPCQDSKVPMDGRYDDDGHSSDLIDDKHYRSQYAESLAAEP